MRLTSCLLLICLGLLLAADVVASEDDRRRVEMAAGIFPRVVAVDQDIAGKLVSGDMVLVLVYDSGEAFASETQKTVQQKAPRVGKFRIKTLVASAAEVMQMDTGSYTALVLVERLERAKLKGLVKHASANARLVMSPFEGDVEQGVMVGLFIGSRIVPFFNMTSLKQASLRIHPKLIEVSRRHE